MTLNETLAGMQAKTDAATKGPWEVDLNVPFSLDLVGIFQPEQESYVVKFDDDEQPRRSDAEFIGVARAAMPALLSAVQNVLALHTPVEWTHLGGPAQACRECARLGSGVNRLTAQWPCPTVQALTDALGGE